MLTKITKYFVVSEEDYSDNSIIPVIDNNRDTIAMVSPEFFAATSLEGTGKLKDDRIINVSGGWAPASSIITNSLKDLANRWYKGHMGYAGLSASGKYYFTFNLSNTEYGIGMNNAHLIPFKSCASDQSVYKYGTILEVSCLKNVTMPDNSLHDGLVKCVDRGSAILGNHIDLFVGSKKWSNMLTMPDNSDVLVK